MTHPSPITRYQVVDEDVEVLVDGTWCTGVQKEIREHADGTLTGWVRYSTQDARGVGENRAAVFPADQIRPLRDPSAEPPSS